MAISFEMLLLFGVVCVAIAFVAWRRGYASAKQHFESSPISEHERIPEAQTTDGVFVTMKYADLETIAWLADWGLRLWIFDNYTRNHDRLEKNKAEEFTAILDNFERKIVPNLLLEDEDSKERRFNSYENRMKNMWEAYPE
jgi:hypothetical protein